MASQEHINIAAALFSEAQDLRDRSISMQADAEKLKVAARKLDDLAAAINDERYSDIVEAALYIAGVH